MVSEHASGSTSIQINKTIMGLSINDIYFYSWLVTLVTAMARDGWEGPPFMDTPSFFDLFLSSLLVHAEARPAECIRKGITKRKIILQIRVFVQNPWFWI